MKTYTVYEQRIPLSYRGEFVANLAPVGEVEATDESDALAQSIHKRMCLFPVIGEKK